MAEARLFQALSDPTRLKIVGILAAGPSNVTGIVNLVGAAQPAVSRHLRILREVGLIHDRRLGKEVEYSLDFRRVEEASGWLGEFVRAGDWPLEDGDVESPVETRKEGEARSGVGFPHDEKSGNRDEEVRSRERGTVTAGGRSPEMPRQSSSESGRGKFKRISPLAARLHGAGASEGSGPALTGKGPEEKQKAATGSTRKRKRRPAAKKPKPKPARKGRKEKETRTEPAYIVEREEDSMDDFLL